MKFKVWTVCQIHLLYQNIIYVLKIIIGDI